MFIVEVSLAHSTAMACNEWFLPPNNGVELRVCSCYVSCAVPVQCNANAMVMWYCKCNPTFVGVIMEFVNSIKKNLPVSVHLTIMCKRLWKCESSISLTLLRKHACEIKIKSLIWIISSCKCKLQLHTTQVLNENVRLSLTLSLQNLFQCHGLACYKLDRNIMYCKRSGLILLHATDSE